MVLPKLIDQYGFILKLLSKIFVDQNPHLTLTVRSVSFRFWRDKILDSKIDFQNLSNDFENISYRLLKFLWKGAILLSFRDDLTRKLLTTLAWMDESSHMWPVNRQDAAEHKLYPWWIESFLKPMVNCWQAASMPYKFSQSQLIGSIVTYVCHCTEAAAWCNSFDCPIKFCGEGKGSFERPSGSCICYRISKPVVDASPVDSKAWYIIWLVVRISLHQKFQTA